MACERWWFNRGCDGTSRRRLCVLLLAFCLYVQPDRSNADNNGLDRYHYELGQSNGGSLASYGPVEFSYVSADGTPEEEEQSFLRLRRAAIDKPIAPTEQTSEERSQHQSEQKLQVQQQQQETTLQQQQQPPKIQNQTQQQQQQQPKTQTQKQPQSVVDTLATPIDITDSTMYTTESSPSASSSSSAIWMGKLETTTDAAAVDKQESSTKSSTMTPQNNSSSKELGPSLPVVNNATNAMNVSAEDNKNTTKLNESTVDSTDLKNDTDTGIGDISMGKFPYVSNKTLSQHNITKMEVDTHQYYNSTFIVDEAIGKKYWVEINKHPALKTNYLLSQSHRRAATVKLKFDFPFYGHKVRNITIATGGFLYTGEYVHSWLAATQYIAPLMANFDTRLSNDSFVKYADNGTAFTVVWEKVVLHDKPKAGAFTFEVTLHQNGDIVFVYSEIPLMVEHIEDKTHPVKVGLSDAYIMDRIVFFVRRKTIYEYHRVNFNRHDIKNWTVIYLKALPTCLEMDNCRDCLTKLKDFDCKWCSELNQCSTGTFRLRQDWLLKGCDVRMIKEVDNCPLQTTTCKDHEEEYNHVHHVLHSGEAVTVSEMNAKQEKPGSSPLERSRDNMNMGVSGIIGILLVIALVVGLVAWAAYAYRNPHSASGQMLIRYRPSQWSWKRGEARYTAATIHM